MTHSTLVTRRVAGLALPLQYQASPKLYKSVTVAQLVVPDLKPGDLVHVTGTGQVQLPAGLARAMQARYLKATKSTDNSSTEGLLLDRAMGHNVTEAQHYGILSAAGSFLANELFSGDVTVMLVMYAAGLSGNPDDIRSLAVKYVELRADRWSA